MRLMKTVMALSVVAGVAGLGSAQASAPDERELWKMLEKSAATRGEGMPASGRTTQKMPRRIDAEETARLLDPNLANP